MMGFDTFLIGFTTFFSSVFFFAYIRSYAYCFLDSTFLTILTVFLTASFTLGFCTRTGFLAFTDSFFTYTGSKSFLDDSALGIIGFPLVAFFLVSTYLVVTVLSAYSLY